jgi:hypothetical protein
MRPMRVAKHGCAAQSLVRTEALRAAEPVDSVTGATHDSVVSRRLIELMQ